MDDQSLFLSAKQKVSGFLTPGGAKNSALFLICAALFCNEQVVIQNIPDISDIEVLAKLLISMEVGCKYERKNKTILIYNQNNIKNQIDENLIKKMRASIFLILPLIKRFKSIHFPYPGGDSIGNRSLDELFRVMTCMGVKCSFDKDYIHLSRENFFNPPQLINLKCVSHSVTLALLMFLSSFSCDETIIHNIYTGPELNNMIEMLNEAGALIRQEKNKIIITSSGNLSGVHIDVITDRVELASYILAAIATNGNIIVRKDDFNLLEAYVKNVIYNMVSITEYNEDKIIIKSTHNIKPFDIIADNSGAFHSDLQNLLIPIANKAHGKSTITDRLFNNRFRQVEDYRSAGLEVSIENHGHTCQIIPHPLVAKDQHFIARDIRGGFSLLILAMILPSGTRTRISNSTVIHRGYEHIVEKFAQLGVVIDEK